MSNDLDLTEAVFAIADSYDIPGTVGHRLAEAVADEVERQVRDRIAADIEAQAAQFSEHSNREYSYRSGLMGAARIARGES